MKISVVPGGTLAVVYADPAFTPRLPAARLGDMPGYSHPSLAGLERGGFRFLPSLQIIPAASLSAGSAKRMGCVAPTGLAVFLSPTPGLRPGLPLFRAYGARPSKQSAISNQQSALSPCGLIDGN